MFKKLRNRLIIINVTITTIVLVFAFATIYLVMQNSSKKRPLPPNEPEFSLTEIHKIDERVNKDRRAAMEELLWLLIVIGLIVEAAVVLISYHFAEIAIQPVQKSYESQKEFIANASHEIKTPLAAISANLEAAEIQDNRWIDNAVKEVQKLTQLNQELLELARADNDGNATQHKELVKVDGVIRETVAAFEAQIKMKRMRLELSLDSKSPKMSLHKKELQQVLTILVDNAVKYGKRNITMAYSDRTLTIENDGASIPKERLGQVFERFYQVDKSNEGHGLGLAIAKTVSENNGWDLTANSDREKTIFILKLN